MATPKIVKAKDTVHNSLNALIYGDSGVGKTTLGATAPKPIFLSAEAGLLSIMDKDIDAIEIKTWDDFVSAFEWLKTDSHGYKTVVIDSLTEVQKKHQEHLLRMNGQPRLSQQAWGDNIEAIRKACRAFRDLPMNTILIATANETVEENGGAIFKRPALQGKSLYNDIAQYFDIVGYMVAVEIKNEAGDTITKRSIRFSPTETIKAKNRKGYLNTWEDPDFIVIHNKIFGKPLKSAKEAK